MSGFVEKARSIDDCLNFVAEKLCFPWDVPSREECLIDALGARSASDVTSPEPYPPFTRSMRDGYALNTPIPSVPPRARRFF